MKANEAPEKLYFGTQGDKGLLDIYSEKESDDDIEYTRTDAFIDRACEFLFDEIYNKIEDNYIRNELMEDSYASKIIKDFKNYMKGE